MARVVKSTRLAPSALKEKLARSANVKAILMSKPGACIACTIENRDTPWPCVFFVRVVSERAQFVTGTLCRSVARDVEETEQDTCCEEATTALGEDYALGYVAFLGKETDYTVEINRLTRAVTLDRDAGHAVGLVEDEHEWIRGKAKKVGEIYVSALKMSAFEERVLHQQVDQSAEIEKLERELGVRDVPLETVDQYDMIPWHRRLACIAKLKRMRKERRAQNAAVVPDSSADMATRV